MCLLARRMVERGVRYVQLYSSDWDGHSECDKNHLENAWEMDKPVAGLLKDLKQRGLIEIRPYPRHAGQAGQGPQSLRLLGLARRGRDARRSSHRSNR